MDSEYDRVRTVRDSRYRYVRNYMPEKPYYQNIQYRLQQPSMRAILALKEQGKLNEVQSLWFRPTKPKEELYDCQKDPYEFNNLAELPQYQPKLKELRKVYEAWIQKVGDTAVEPEMEMVRRWWNGKEQAPVTETPKIQPEFSKITLSCATKGASIGYKQRWKDPSWKVYTQPINASAGDSLYVVAHRIGYQKSPVVVLKLN